MITVGFPKQYNKLYTRASTLALFTIAYNTIEGLASVFFGFKDESLTLFGFGVDSFVEVVSGVGIWHMVQRIRHNGEESPDRFEQTALKITGSGFYILTIGLSITAAINLYQGHKPETTFWGIVISIIAIVVMWLLAHYKEKVGQELGSQAILSDAACTRVCLQLSVVLLIASAGYELTHIGGIDSVGTFVIAWICYREGREAFEKAKAKSFACTCGGSCEANENQQTTE
ncbi:MAG TPA: cation transporter [Nitrospirota bacterium]|nr:cation transporter [Nitrospirota bacterium]